MKIGRWAVLSAIVLTGCASDDPFPRASTVGVVATGCSLAADFGGGVVVGPGLVATTAHTVAGASDIEVDVDGRRLTATLVGFDKDVDVAILSAAVGVEPASFGRLDAGDRGTVETWHPDQGTMADFAEVTRRLLVTIEDIYVEGEHQRRALEIAAPINPGDSGAPIYTDQGEVAGIVYATSRVRADIGFVVRASEIEAVLSRVGDDAPSLTTACT